MIIRTPISTDSPAYTIQMRFDDHVRIYYSISFSLSFIFGGESKQAYNSWIYFELRALCIALTNIQHLTRFTVQGHSSERLSLNQMISFISYFLSLISISYHRTPHQKRELYNLDVAMAVEKSNTYASKHLKINRKKKKFLNAVSALPCDPLLMVELE